MTFAWRIAAGRRAYPESAEIRGEPAGTLKMLFQNEEIEYCRRSAFPISLSRATQEITAFCRISSALLQDSPSEPSQSDRHSATGVLARRQCSMGGMNTMAGVTSNESRAAQQGPVELVTTDGFGKLASDGGAFPTRPPRR